MESVNTLLTHSDLVNRAGRWLETSSRFRCSVVLREYKCYANEIPDVIGFNKHRSILIECKASRADFLADRNKPHRHYRQKLGAYRYYLVPPHICCPEDVPEGWGLLYLFPNKIIEVKPAINQQDDSVKAAEWSILFSVVRRMQLRHDLNEIYQSL